MRPARTSASAAIWAAAMPANEMAWLYEEGSLVKAYPIAIGRPDSDRNETDAGACSAIGTSG